MDLAFSSWVAGLHIPWLDTIMVFITRLGDHGFIWFLLSGVLVARKSTRKAGIVCIVSLLLYTLISTVFLKNMFARERPFTHLPDLELLISIPSGFSFPSGHAGSSFATAYAFHWHDRKWGKMALALAVFISISRVYLTVHYFTDVLVGALLGILCAYVARWFIQSFYHSR